MSRANSLKKAVREIIEHTERAVDDQNQQTIRLPPPTILLEPSEDTVVQRVSEHGITMSGLQVGVKPKGKPTQIVCNIYFVFFFSF